jgi:hypothetical protein
MGAHRFAALVLEWSCWLPLVNLVLCTIATADLSKRELSERFSFSNIVEGAHHDVEEMSFLLTVVSWTQAT